MPPLVSLFLAPSHFRPLACWALLPCLSSARARNLSRALSHPRALSHSGLLALLHSLARSGMRRLVEKYNQGEPTVDENGCTILVPVVGVCPRQPRVYMVLLCYAVLTCRRAGCLPQLAVTSTCPHIVLPSSLPHLPLPSSLPSAIPRMSTGERRGHGVPP